MGAWTRWTQSNAFLRNVNRSWPDPKAAQPQPDAMDTDECGDALCHQRLSDQLPEHCRGSRGLRAPTERRRKCDRAGVAEDDARADEVRTHRKPQLIAAADVVERRDVELFVMLSLAVGIGVEQVGVPLAIGVVDLRYDAREVAGAVVAPKDRERIEDMTEDARIGQHQNLRALTQLDAAQREKLLHVGLDRGTGIAEMIGTAEAGERAQTARRLG